MKSKKEVTETLYRNYIVTVRNSQRRAKSLNAKMEELFDREPCVRRYAIMQTMMKDELETLRYNKEFLAELAIDKEDQE